MLIVSLIVVFAAPAAVVIGLKIDSAVTPPPPFCSRITSGALQGFYSEVEQISQPALQYDEGFSSAIQNALGGSSEGGDAWGATSQQSILQQVEERLSSMTVPAGSGPALPYMRLGVQTYIASTQAVIDAAKAPKGSLERRELLYEGQRLESLGDSIFDRGRGLISIIDGGSLVLAPAIPNYTMLGISASYTTVRYVDEVPTSAPAWRQRLNQSVPEVKRWITSSDWKSLGDQVNADAVAVPGNGCLTEVARGIREATETAAEGAFAVAVMPAGPLERSLKASLDGIALDLWDVSASAGGWHRLPS